MSGADIQMGLKAASSTRYRAAFVVTAGLFTIWGLAQWCYAVLFPQFAQFFALNPSQTTWTQSLFNIAYCAMAVPAIMFQRVFGYKAGVILALSGLSLGPFLVYPALTGHVYLFFLAAVVLLGSGWAFFETSVNALIVQMGNSQTAVQRLNLAQAFYPVGLIAGSYAALWLLSTNSQLPVGVLAPTVARPYVWVGLCVLLLGFVIDKVSFPQVAIERAGKASSIRDEFRDLLQRPAFRIAAAALACNILAQSITWGTTFAYVMQEMPHASAPVAGQMIVWSIMILGIGRFVGTGLMFVIPPARLLAACSATSLILIIGAAVLGGMPGLACLVATSLFMSIMYATIFATGIRDLGPLTKAGSGLMVTAAGLAAACSPALIIAALGMWAAKIVILLSAPCFVVVLVHALRTSRQR